LRGGSEIRANSNFGGWAAFNDPHQVQIVDGIQAIERREVRKEISAVKQLKTPAFQASLRLGSL
jgi:hypothetical protein